MPDDLYAAMWLHQGVEDDGVLIFRDGIPDDDAPVSLHGPVRHGQTATFQDAPNPPEPWAPGGDIPTSGPAAALFPDGFDRFGGLSQAEYMRRYWDGAVRDWRTPPNEGAAGPITANTLDVGDRIDRFGPATGVWASPVGTPYPQRALPSSSVARDYFVWEVLRPLPDTVRRSEIAPWFEMPGGGIQYIFDSPEVQGILWYEEHGYLEDVTDEY